MASANRSGASAAPTSPCAARSGALRPWPSSPRPYLSEFCQSAPLPQIVSRMELLPAAFSCNPGRRPHVPRAVILSSFWGLFLTKYRLAVFLPFLACLAQAQGFINGQAARAVFGQQEFTFGTALASGTAQYLLGGPSGLAYSNGLLFVADSNVLGATATPGSVVAVNNNRVVVYD